MKYLLPILLMLGLTIQAQSSTTTKATYEYQIITSVESLVPNGLGRSRLIAETENRDFEDYTSQRTNEKKRNTSNRKDIRVSDFEETKLLNFYNLAGIRFQNIAANDALVTSKLNSLAQQGWELAFVTSGVESDAGDTDGQGIFITRYILKRLIQ